MAIETIEETLARAGQRGKVLQRAFSGFIRFSSGRSTVIMDSGSPQTSAVITDTVHWRLNLQLVKICWLLIPGNRRRSKFAPFAMFSRPIRHLV